MNAYEIRSNQVIEYMKIHLISLQQDLEKAKSDESPDEEYFGADTYYEGAIYTARHLMSVVADILGIELEETK